MDEERLRSPRELLDDFDIRLFIPGSKCPDREASMHGKPLISCA